MSGILALTVLLVLALSRMMAFASPPDATWIHGIYDGADGDEAVIRTTDRVGFTPLVFTTPVAGRHSEPIVAPAVPHYWCRMPVADARGPPPDACRAAIRSADPILVESARLNVAVPLPVPWPAPRTDPVPGRRPFAWPRGPPEPLCPDRQAVSRVAHPIYEEAPMNRWLPLLMLMAMVTVLLVPVVSVSAEDMKSQGAWCGGSWDPGAVDSAGKAVEKGGSNFGKCGSVSKSATHPAYPAKQIVIREDTNGKLAGGTMQSGKFVPIPRRVVPKK